MIFISFITSLLFVDLYALECSEVEDQLDYLKQLRGDLKIENMKSLGKLQQDHDRKMGKYTILQGIREHNQSLAKSMEDLFKGLSVDVSKLDIDQGNEWKRVLFLLMEKLKGSEKVGEDVECQGGKSYDKLSFCHAFLAYGKKYPGSESESVISNFATAFAENTEVQPLFETALKIFKKRNQVFKNSTLISNMHLSTAKETVWSQLSQEKQCQGSDVQAVGSNDFDKCIDSFSHTIDPMIARSLKEMRKVESLLLPYKQNQDYKDLNNISLYLVRYKKTFCNEEDVYRKISCHLDPQNNLQLKSLLNDSFKAVLELESEDVSISNLEGKPEQVSMSESCKGLQERGIVKKMNKNLPLCKIAKKIYILNHKQAKKKISKKKYSRSRFNKKIQKRVEVDQELIGYPAIFKDFYKTSFRIYVSTLKFDENQLDRQVWYGQNQMQEVSDRREWNNFIATERMNTSAGLIQQTTQNPLFNYKTFQTQYYNQ